MNFSLFLQAIVLAAIALAIQARYVYVEPISDAEKRNFDREFMHFGKRSGGGDFDRNFMNFGKRSDFDRPFMPFGKRTNLEEMMNLQKKDDDVFRRDFMSFGRRR